MIALPSRTAFLLRIDARLWDDLAIWARDELRGGNGRIEFLLRQAVQKRKGAARELLAPPAEDDPPAG
jgi:hypothetical protein